MRTMLRGTQHDLSIPTGHHLVRNSESQAGALSLLFRGKEGVKYVVLDTGWYPGAGVANIDTDGLCVLMSGHS